MPGPNLVQPPEASRLSGLFRFIAPEQFDELGIDPDDVPLGTYPAENHPPFLPHRFGGNAYGLGLFEQSLLPFSDVKIFEDLDLADPNQVASRYREINDVFKRLGLLIRYTKKGSPFYLIPRQFVAQYLVDIQGRLGEITTFLSALMSRRLRETLKVGLLAEKNEILFPELQSRMPDLEFSLLDSLDGLTQPETKFDAVVVMDDFREFILRLATVKGATPPADRQAKESYGYFATGLICDLLRPEGEVLCLGERPLGSSRENMTVQFVDQGEFKRFLLFSHLFRTRRRYQSREGMKIEVNRFDFNAFLSGRFFYQGTMEGLFNGQPGAYVDPAEIDGLPYQDLPLPRGSAPQMLSAWRRWFGPFFSVSRISSVLPPVVCVDWESRYHIQGEFPPTLLVLHGKKNRPPVSMTNLTGQLERQRLAGCSVGLLAGYKNSFAYVHKVLNFLEQVRGNTVQGLPGLELSRLRRVLQTAEPLSQLNDILKLMKLAPALPRLEERLNPGGTLGAKTPVLENLEKLSLMGIKEGPLRQLCLIVLGHSTLSRVTFGKLPETSLRYLSEPKNYANPNEAIGTLRLYRLLSVAESAAASQEGLSPEQLRELFNLADEAIRVVSTPSLSWEGFWDAQMSKKGGVQAMATRKMLKLFNLFEFLDNWQELEEAGTHQKEALADFDQKRLARSQKVMELIGQVRRFVGRFYQGDSTARPFFFRALLNCELHGTGRLFPRLGPAAGFTLLWICILGSERRLLDFNPLLEVKTEEELSQRLEKLRRLLLMFSPEQLSPKQMANLKETVSRKGEAYVYESGLYFKLHPNTGALTPGLVDAQQEITLLKNELDATLNQTLGQVPSSRLRSMDHRTFEVGRFWAALDLKSLEQASESHPFLPLITLHAQLSSQLLDYVLKQLFDLPRFAANLNLLIQNCPRLMDRLLPQPTMDPHTAHRLAAAIKLSSLITRRYEGFQNMKASHEAARLEFGSAASGIVGISAFQFHILAESLGRLVKTQPRLGRLLMLAVLLVHPPDESENHASLAASALARRLNLSKRMEKDLLFLLEFNDRIWQIISGQSCLLRLAELLATNDPLLTEALFILSVICTAARSEGFLTEDLLDQFLDLRQKIHGLFRRRASARLAFQQHLEHHARQRLAFEHYREIQEGEAPTASLRQLLETTPIPENEREAALKRGQESAGLERLLKLRGLYAVNTLDLLMLQHEIPVVYIYRLKGLRSIGPTHFERDLYEALRLYHGLQRLDKNLQEFILRALADPEESVRLVGFAPAAGLLTYPNQICLLFLGLAAARWHELRCPRPLTVSFWPLAKLIERKFEVINQAINELNPAELYQDPGRLRYFLDSREGLTMHLDGASCTLSLTITDLARFDRKIEAVRRAKRPAKLKQLYHNELRKLKLTTYSTLDYQQRLEGAFLDNLERLGEAMLERVRRQMSKADDLDELGRLFEVAWEEGLELPLPSDRQQSLRDLFEMNVERLRARFLADLDQRLNEINSLESLDELWEKVKEKLKAHRHFLGKEFDLLVARRFDRRIAEIKGQSIP